MIFGYTADQAQKFLVSIVAGILLVAGFWIAFEPGTTTLVTAAIIYAFGAWKVFSTANSSPADWAKASEQLTTSIVSLVGLYVTVAPSTLEVILAAVANGVAAYAVFRARNKT